MKAKIIIYNAMVRERNARLEAIAGEVHFWQYDRDPGSELDVLLDNQRTDLDMIDFLLI